MAAWFVLSLVGAIALAFGLWRYVSGLGSGRGVKRSFSVMGILFPVVVALFYSSTLFGVFPDLTIIDTTALFSVGVISGFFLGVLVLQVKLNREQGANQ